MTDQNKSRSDRWIQGAGLVAAIIAILVTIFFSVRSERSKELSVTVLAKRPLLSVDASTPSSGLEVRLKGEPVSSPWLVSLKVENTGELSIEERDIESPLRLVFNGAKPISVETQSRSDRSISSISSVDGNSITLRHKLLNPSDWIAVDILFDGEPSIPPVALTRISGVTSPKTFSLKPVPDNRSRFAPFGIPMPLVYTALVIASFLAIAMTAGGAAIGYQTMVALIKPTRQNVANKQSIVIDESHLHPLTDEGRDIYRALGGRVTIDLLEDSEAIANEVAKIPAQLLASFGLDAASAARRLRRELIESIRTSVASQLYASLPSGIDRVASDELRGLDVQGLGPKEIIEKGELVLREFSGSVVLRSGPDKSDLLGAFGLVVLGLALSLVSIGGWNVALG